MDQSDFCCFFQGYFLCIIVDSQELIVANSEQANRDLLDLLAAMGHREEATCTADVPSSPRLRISAPYSFLLSLVYLL